MDKNTNVPNSKASNDCLGCRLISGFGVIGIAAYLFHQARQRKNLEKHTIKLISCGAFMLGSARLLDIKLFKPQKTNR